MPIIYITEHEGAAQLSGSFEDVEGKLLRYAPSPKAGYEYSHAVVDEAITYTFPLSLRVKSYDYTVMVYYRLVMHVPPPPPPPPIPGDDKIHVSITPRCEKVGYWSGFGWWWFLRNIYTGKETSPQFQKQDWTAKEYEMLGCYEPSEEETIAKWKDKADAVLKTITEKIQGIELSLKGLEDWLVKVFISVVEKVLDKEVKP